MVDYSTNSSMSGLREGNFKSSAESLGKSNPDAVSYNEFEDMQVYEFQPGVKYAVMIIILQILIIDVIPV
jgi:hypothetical protein